MQSVNFEILRHQRPALAELGSFAEHYLHSDPASALTKLRIYGEQITKAIYWELRLKPPAEATFDRLLAEPDFKKSLPPVVLDKLHVLRKEGNKGAHGGQIDPDRVPWVLEEAYQLGSWFMVRFYGSKPTDIPPFQTIAKPPPQKAGADADREALEARLAALVAERDALKQAYQAQAAQPDSQARAQQAADALLFDEATTRRRMIDVALADAGWLIGAKGQNTDQVGQEVEVTGQPTATGIGYADYVLWDDDHKPLAVIEAKKTTVSPETGRKQAELYATALERQYGLRPAIFTTNGYDIWLWDDAGGYPERKLYGFYSKASLQHLVRFKRSSRQPLSSLPLNPAIAGGPRLYQAETIKRVTEAFEKKHTKALIVQATGTGKTRVAVALTDLLIRAKWVTRVLFLCDRNELRKQAKNAFTDHLPTEPLTILNASTARKKEDRIHIATYPAMMNIFQTFDVGYFDLIIADESHRSVYNVYGDIFRYFDALQVGLTATPVEFISRNTFGLFGCKNQDPTAAYTLERAVEEKWLVPYEVFSHTTQFLRDGIKYDDLSDRQKQEVEDDPDTVEHEAGDLGRLVFNKDTERQILRNLMENGIRDATGQLPGKSVIFARNHDHAVLLETLFNEMYPQYGGKFCQVIDTYNPRAEALIDDFKGDGSNNDLTIALSVDMLDTGIDVPEIVNLVFAKPVRSRVKFWQMIGRGTRRCEDLFGPGQDKSVFRIFDHWGNFEYFAQNKPEAQPNTPKPLMQRLFEARLDLAATALSAAEIDAFTATARLIEADVRALPEDSISVREHLQEVHALLQDGVIEDFAPATVHRLKKQIAPLMQWVNVRGATDALTFDLLATTLQTAHLKKSSAFDTLKAEVVNAVNSLQMNLNPVKAKADSIRRVKSPEFWSSVTLPRIEDLRQDLRGIMQYCQTPGGSLLHQIRVYDITEDETQIQTEKRSSNLISIDLAAYRARVEQALTELFATDPTLKKIRAGQKVSPTDLETLVSLVLTRHPDVDLHTLTEFFHDRAAPLDQLIRRIVGLDPQAVKAHFATFIQTYPALSASQTQFLQLLQNHIAQNGGIELARLADAPFTHLAEDGIFGVFPSDAQRDHLLAMIKTFQPEGPSPL
ncbi:DEAD/DEAH box helicase family protein [Novispirillum itersonii]|uniref:DEAD/DEAH box helicase family protein n=1 Tax=Novispirillum itersonii TaxID=189 RepID=UPI00037D51FC|nr:DEAD/DEAH box helicase family protein [Novispirillum itersonii]